MKVFIKNSKIKIITLMILVLAILSTAFIYKIYAAEVTPSMKSEGTGMANGQVGAKDYLTVNDLWYRYEIFCCSKGTPLTGSGKATLVTEKGSSDPGYTGKLVPGDVGAKLFETNLKGENTTTPFTKGTYTNNTYGNYTVTEVKVCTPMEAYILAEMINNLPNMTNAGLKFEGEENGHRIEYTDVDSLNNCSYMVVEGKQVYMIENTTGEEKLVMKDTDGKYYYVKEDTDQGLGIYSYVQRAWWNTDAVTSASNPVPSNGLTEEARAFETYIARIAKSMDTSTFVDTDIKLEDNTTVRVKAPEIEYNPSFNTNKTLSKSNYDLDNPTVSWDDSENVYKIGPFSIDYVEADAAVDGRSAVQFAGITDSKLYTDASSEALSRGTDWNFLWLDGERKVDDKYQFPHENEVFYITLKDIENATQITDFSFDFRYMNAGGQFENLKGTFYTLTWTAKSKDNICTDGHTCSHGRVNAHSWTTGSGDNKTHHSCSGGTACEHGYYRTHVESTDYWVELTSASAPKESQQLAGGLIAARGYEETSISRELNIPKSGKISIKKELLDSEGNKINSNKYFYFRVTVKGATNSGTDIVKVKANSRVETKYYYWKNEDQAPTYHVEEIPQDGYVCDIENADGSLKDGYCTSTRVKATNTEEPNEGYLKVTKKADDKVGHADTIANKDFNIQIKLSGKFKYDNKSYENETLVINTTLKIGQTWESSGSIKWNKDQEAPKYEVIETGIENDNDAKLVSIVNGNGSITPSDKKGATLVTVTNAPKPKEAKLQIIKTLENSNLLDEDEIKKLVFTFNIKVDGYNEQQVKLNAERSNDGSYVWKYTSDNYYWYGSTTPKYTITEVNNPTGTTFKSAKVDGTQVSTSGSTVTGTLSQNNTSGHTVVNEIINTAEVKTGNIELTKHIKEDDETLKNSDYKFYITIYGTKFTYKGVTYNENQKIQLTNDSAILLNDAGDYDKNNMVVIHVGAEESAKWTSDTFTWVGNAPQYKVEENVLGQDVDYSVEPHQGYISDKENSSDPLKITAWNRSIDSKAGYIHIIKTLENADKYTNEYISNLKFQFKIEVDKYEPSIVTLEAEKKDNTWVWEYTSDAYSWKGNENAPGYTITELASDDYELVSITGDGTAVDVSNYKVSGTLKESTTSDVLITTDNTFLNKLKKEHTGNIEIDKSVLSDSIADISFKFKVTLKGTFTYDGEEIVNGEKTIDATASSKSPWKSSDIKWKGEAPTYSVSEVEIPEKNGVPVAEVKSVLNGSGTVKEGETEGATVVTFVNDAKKTGGNLVIEKTIQGGGMNSQDVFYFAVAIGDMDEYVVSIKAGETYTSDWITWDASEDAPKYSVTELKSDAAESVSISNAQGTLAPNTSVTVQAVNKYQENNGNFRIEKFVLADEKLLDGKANATFKIDYIVSSEYTFEIDGKTYGPGNSYTGTVEIQGGQSFTSPNIKWYGNHAPIVQVSEEISDELANNGWKNVGISNNNVQLTADDTVIITVTNELPTNVIIDLTMNLAGNVWVEDVDENDKNTENSVANGLKDNGEKAPEDLVEVYIYYKGTDTLATIYADISGTEIDQPLYTDAETGNWEAPRVKVPTGIADAYDVVFVYDGQKYEPTTFLATSNGNASEYIGSSNSEKSKFFNNSMAKDANREEVNNRIKDIYGNQVIDSNMYTIGKVNGDSGESDVAYQGELNQSGALGIAGLTQMVSKLQTYDSNTLEVYDLYKATAKTSIGGLNYPFDVDGYDGIHLENYNTYISELGITQKYQYQAIYKYCQHINLGLVERAESDVEVNKDLESATVVVNDTKTDYTFNKLDDFGKDCLTRKVQASTNNIKYQLGLYETDYFYRAEMYKSDATIYDTLLTAYKDYENLKATEMEVFLNYRITVYNSSGSYIAKFNSINDYFDSSFVAPISENTYANIKDENGNFNSTLVAESSYMQKVNSTDKTSVNWTPIENAQNINGSDGLTYNGYSVDLSGLKLNPGEYADIHVSFKVSKDTTDGVQDAIILGDKSNVVEIGNYSILNLDGSNAGKIDGDSAPANVDIRNHNNKTWYEDDTDQAPVLSLELQGTQRQVNGIAWEDKAEDSTDGTAVGNGIYDSDEALIAGLTTQMVEKIALNNVEYDFVWPTSKPLDQLGGKSLQELTGYDSTIETSRENDPENGVTYGSYNFNAVPTGNYAVRFLYGIDKTKLEDNFDVSGAPVALDQNGNIYSENENILTANYDGDKETYTAAVYNGQDYKTTLNQSSTLNNRYYNLNTDETLRVNDAIDSETQRLATIANSETITNVIANELMTANYKDAIHTGLYNNYNMFADTPIIKVTTEVGNADATKVKGTISENGTLKVSDEITTYKINNIDCGIVERPETNLVLDKQISSVSLTTNDGNVIFDAKYDINYDIVSENDAKDKTIISKLDNNKYLVANVTLNEKSSKGIDILQAVNKTENKITSEDKSGEENFRFIQVEDTILQGTQIDIHYQLTALNISDVDYTTADLASKTSKQEIIDLAKDVKSTIPDLSKNLEIGKYLGSYYYTGDSTNNEIVKTKVRQVVDYIDNDAVFTEANNQNRDASWKRTTITELSGSGVEANRLVDVAVIPEYSLTDNLNREYVTDSKQNIVLSVDNQENQETSSNIGFEKDLTPFVGDTSSDDYKSTINLQISRVVAAGDVTNNSSKYDFENVSEIVKFENDAGRRDEAAVVGNANPHLGEFTLDPITNFERDTSATEVITFTPPTGIDSGITMQMQILIVVASSLVILVIGIVIIKKRVLK